MVKKLKNKEKNYRKMEKLKNKVRKRNDLKKYLMKCLIIIKKNKTNDKNKMKKRKILLYGLREVNIKRYIFHL